MLLSESQERMLIVARKGMEKQVVEIFAKWDLDCVVIGKVVEGDRLRIHHNGELMADLPVLALTDEAPKYQRPMSEPPASAGGQIVSGHLTAWPPAHAGGSDLSQALKQLLASPNICSKHWVYEQYDTMVRTNTAICPGADAAVIRVKETRRAIAMCLDGNGKFTAINAYEGAKLAVAEAARNVACVGAKPIAVTNCLNFASPERPEVMRSFSDVIDGLTDACEAFETPVVSGNVSFYNETDGKGILPTPVIGMVGLIEDTRKLVTQGFKNEGDVIAVLGTTRDDLMASEYAQTILGLSTDEIISNGAMPVVDLAVEKRLQETLLSLINECLLCSAHDCSDGGLAVAIAESCFSSLDRDCIGAEIAMTERELSAAADLFAETPSRIVISFDPAKEERVRELAGGVPMLVLGRVTGDTLNISINTEPVISTLVDELESAWKNALGEILDN
jgi:phosphoribosylformylglycinamidine synthase